MNIWISLLWISPFGSAFVLSTFLIWKCPISYEHLKFPDWKRQISHEFPCLECQISYEFPCLDVQMFISNCQISYEFLCLEVPNFIRISLLGSNQFHMNIWNSLIGRAQFHMNFSVWKCAVSYEFPCLEVPNFTWTCEIPWLEGLNSCMNFLVC